jgi:hypothetical protein
MFSTEDFIIAVFCCVDDLWNQTTQGRAIRQRGFSPSLSDSEVITSLLSEWVKTLISRWLKRRKFVKFSKSDKREVELIEDYLRHFSSQVLNPIEDVVDRNLGLELQKD